MEKTEKAPPPLAQHIEKYLGTIQSAWTRSAERKEMPFHVLKCSGGMVDEATAFCTFGLSDFAMQPLAPHEPEWIRHELMILVPQSFGDRNIPVLLQQLGLRALNRDKAYAPGDIASGEGEIFKGLPFTAFFTAFPNSLPDEFRVYDPPDRPRESVAFLWMIPVTPSEADFVKTNGGEKFEEILEAENADMVDLGRDAFV
jgi:hypothetical protein